MKNSFRLLCLVTAAAMISACSGDRAKVSGTLGQVAGKELVVRMLDVNQYVSLDTVRADSKGSFTFSVPLRKGQPEFIYVFDETSKLVSLILNAGDKVSIGADAAGATVIEGSEESVLLNEVEENFSRFANEFAALDASGATAGQKAKSFIDHYRRDVAFIMQHPYSMANIPVLYEKINEYSPVFSQNTDALIFRRVADSLATRYPDSRYVKALEKETVRMEKLMELGLRISGAREANYPDLSLPDLSGNKTSISSLDSKAMIVHFWDSADAGQKMFNLDVLMPLYERYHARGLEIYAVDVNPDKALWAAAVKAQQLPWVNVNDGQGANSPALLIYNVSRLPASILISDSGMQGLSSEAQLRSALEKIL